MAATTSNSTSDSLTKAINSVISSNISSTITAALSNTSSIAAAAAAAAASSITATRTATNAKKHALLIGCNYTNSPGNTLKGCINDIVNVENVLIDAYGYYKENIVMLRDDSTNPAFWPTAANIMAQLHLIVANSGSYSQIWIHYSGHGVQQVDAEQTCLSDTGVNTHLEGCIVPMDFVNSGYITRDIIYDQIKNIACPAIMMWDACHSGTLCDLEWSFVCQTSAAYTRTKTNNVASKNLEIYSISGCRDAQVSYDSYNTEAQLPMGAFTQAVIECLRQSRHNIPIMLLYRNVCAYLAKSGISQLPVLSSFNDKPSIVIMQ